MFYQLVFQGRLVCSVAATLSICSPLFGQEDLSKTAHPAGQLSVDFASEIRPILAIHCFSCHGPDEKSRSGELRLDLKSSAVESSAIVPNDSAKSELVTRIYSDDLDYQMPPPSSKKALSDKQKLLLKNWIEQGAEYSNHWAFEVPQRPKLHSSSLSSNSLNNPIDYLVGRRLERENLKPSPRADRSTLLRRLSLDLTGLPPTVGQLTEFLSDESPQAYEKAVDRLLSSKHYAEKMAMEWLDLARYADTNGYNNDEDRTMWPWRDWVIRAFDSNMPFDQFTIEQLAGDLLPNPSQDQLIATGFLRNQGHNTEGGIILEEYRVEYVADRVHTVSTVFLGLSMQCARCHDHKFDPISQTEYYQFYSFFNSLDEKQASYSKFVGAEPFIRVPTDDQASKIIVLDAQISDLQAQLNQRKSQADANIEQIRAETPQDELTSRFAQVELHHFPLDQTDPAAIVDSISNSTIGVKAGKIVWREGKQLQAIELAEDTRIELGPLAVFSGDRPFSLSVWVRPQGSDTMAILSKMDESQGFRGYDLLFSSGKVEMHLVHHWPDNAIKVSTKQAFKPDEWHHIVATYDGSKTGGGVKIYVDSKLAPVDIVQDSLRDSIETAEPFRIGLRQTTLPFRGLIDDLRCFGSELIEENVKQVASLEPVTSFADWLQIPAELRSQAVQEQIRQYYLNRIDKEYSNLQERLANSEKERAAIKENFPAVMILAEMNPPRETFVLKRGQYDQPTDKVESNIPAALLKAEAVPAKDRLALARWLVSNDNPLTARVAVNRWWQNYFGTGIVKTVEDFGLTGEAPSNPELLDYLAFTFMENGWNVKALQKLIVMSSTYQQESRIEPDMLQRDPENRLLARGARHRLSAETIRDNALMLSGLLQPRIGGPSVKPYQPSGLWEDVTVERKGKYVADTGEGLYRRSLYSFWKRTCPPPSMMSFDAPNREVCLARRARTNTPLQSLVLLNDPTYIECARLLAQNAIHDGGSDDTERIHAAMLRAVSRKATQDELKILIEILDKAKLRFSKLPDDAQALNAVGATPPDSSIDAKELAAWTIVMSTILNLDETITKR